MLDSLSLDALDALITEIDRIAAHCESCSRSRSRR